MRQFSLTPPFCGCRHLQMSTFTEQDSLKRSAVSALVRTGELCPRRGICVYVPVSQSCRESQGWEHLCGRGAMGASLIWPSPNTFELCPHASNR